MFQADLLGTGIARVLRQQADDVRARRRERAIAFANALPVKRLIPWSSASCPVCSCGRWARRSSSCSRWPTPSVRPHKVHIQNRPGAVESQS